ncbi:filamentous hemagglutinin N-terminal domain-containing protein [Trinickia dinghuensis]|uniref:Filamentous hemagglutinin N-terminal domain-containing protein n=2 Tax=Trinickia dinghuensis TaxID=2291023 RepID=A0A3D8JPV8_9BURK|nr:filamentous hemagglutinin N-terminal domain-containing protein [Trinickia dinghuensis]
MLFVLSAVATLCGAPSLANAGTPSLPSGGHFIAGSGSITGNSAGTTLTINQNTSRGVIDWDGFSIDGGHRVNFNNGSGATLNRVTGGDPSLIVGALTATGSVYLINPQGIVVGPTGTVSTGGRFVASTLDADNTAFMNNAPLTLTGSSNHKVINLGKIGSSGGDVFLVSANEVDNFGSISARKGTAELDVGRQVLLQDSSSGQQVFVQTSSEGTVRNTGAIKAAQISLQAADGNIFALSGNHEVLRATGTTTRDGHIWLVADTGTVDFGGEVEAKNHDRSGGTVDISAGNLMLCDCGPTVSAGVWNITTPSFVIGDTAALAFSHSLNAGTSINLQTTGASGQSGNIDVASNLAWHGAASLNLAAYHSVYIDKGVVKNRGTGNLTLRADATAIDNGGTVANFSAIDWSKSTGSVSAYYDLNGSYRAGTQLANTSWTAPAYSGLRTQFTGYQLVNALADLENIGNNLAGNYALGKDIDANGNSINPLGSFAGQFDGMGHTISSWSIQGQSGQTVGLFSSLGQGSIVRDLNVNGSVFMNQGDDFGSSGVEGILAGDNEGTILRVNTSGSLGVGGWFYDSTTAGGIAGVNHGTILRSSSSATNNAGGPMGGLVGENDGLVSQSFASGSVSAAAFGAHGESSVGSPGGLVGTNNGTITQSYATGSVGIGCNEYYCGNGAALVNTNHGTISQSFATGGGTPDGVAAQNSGTIASDVYWNKDTTTAAIGVGSGTPVAASNGLTTAQMSNPASFTGWNFGSGGDWVMPAGATHPVLAWQVSSPASQ